jgi:4-hydroxybenzoate polyprenyltransferase
MLYLAGICWTLGYDTIYAHQDRSDDEMIGVKSTALRFGASTPYWLTVFYGAAVTLLALAGFSAGLESWLFGAGLALAAGHFAWQVITLDIDDAKDCLAKFRSNRLVGVIVFAAIVAGHHLP